MKEPAMTAEEAMEQSDHQCPPSPGDAHHVVPTDKPFDFHHEHDGSLSLESAVYQALGFASVCWEDGTRGVFQEDKVRQCAEALLTFVRKQPMVQAWAHLRQLTMTVPEYEWLTNAGVIVRLAEESAASRGWRLGTQEPSVEPDAPGRLALCWLASEHPDGAPGAYQDLFNRRDRELKREQPYFTYWVVAPTWDQMESEVQQRFQEFALMVCRHEGHLVTSGMSEMREQMGEIPVVGLRWAIAHRREVVDVRSALV